MYYIHTEPHNLALSLGTELSSETLTLLGFTMVLQVNAVKLEHYRLLSHPFQFIPY
jgi:hypothetical protein